ncbi:MAG: hypothetical protein RLZZ28_718, partial [Bacteroidota bacterium]
GQIQSEFTDTLSKIGNWIASNGPSIYGTRGNIVPAQDWGVVTANKKTVFIHILYPGKIQQPFLFVPGIKGKITRAGVMGKTNAIKIRQQEEGLFVYLNEVEMNGIDTIIELTMQ